jgi:hypothetical protein
MIARLPEKLRSLGMGVESRPTRLAEFQVDESGFDAALEKRIGYRNPKARMHDVDCVAAIAQLRQGRHTYELESSRAIFVTTNSGLARVTREVFQADAPEGSVALCITDYSLGNLLWLKNPTRAPDLPQKLLLADVYAAMQPPDALWMAYLAEIARLQEQGSITTDEYFTLRYSLTARRTLMDLTAGNAAAFTEGTVAEVLRVAKENLRADLEEQLARERKKVHDAEQTVVSLEEREVARRERIATRAARVASVTSRIVCVALLAFFTAGALLTFPWSLPQFKHAWYRYLTTTVLAAFFVYTLANITWGSSIRSIRESLERWLARQVHRWLARIAE